MQHAVGFQHLSFLQKSMGISKGTFSVFLRNVGVSCHLDGITFRGYYGEL